jgi:hypothetical protein
MRGKSNLIKRNVEKVWGARYLPKNTVILTCESDNNRILHGPQNNYTHGD